MNCELQTADCGLRRLHPQLHATRHAPRALAVACALTAFTSPLAAQADVGYPPNRSPFRDLEYRQELTFFGGQFAAAKDPAGVAPRSGLMVGLRYEIGVGGPVQLVARTSYIASERRGVNPQEPAATRDLGIRSWPMYAVDVGISMNLTGQKSYRRFVPTLNGGIGFVSDGGRSVEDDPWRLGTVFSLVYGAGLRYVPGGRFQLRFGADSYLYRLNYPSAYYVAASDNTTVVSPTQARTFWKNNWALTIGASYLFGR